MAGATWSMNYVDTKTKPPKPTSSSSQTDGWRVDGVDEVITVPLGTFLSLHLTRVEPVDSSTKSSGSCAASARSRNRPAAATTKS